nr:uncharacterized protein LOC108125053 [Drosophila bipectinata]
MSCICEYYSGGENNQTGDDQVDPSLETTPTSDENGPAAANSTKEEENDSEAGTKDLEVSASDLADCQAENWLLKKKLLDYEVTIENLEQLVTTIVEKQHQILSEMFQLRKENRELLTECQMQREYHFMERNALMKELHDLRTLPVDKRRVLVISICSFWNITIIRSLKTGVSFGQRKGGIRRGRGGGVL